MKHLRKKFSMKEQLDEALAELGDERLAGSGFGSETDDKRFSGAALLPSTFVPDWSSKLGKLVQSPQN